MEVKEILVRAPWGEVAHARIEGPLGIWVAALHVPPGASPGAAALDVAAVDAAGNVGRTRVAVRVEAGTPPTAARAGLGAVAMGFAAALAVLLGLAAAALRRRAGPAPVATLLLGGVLEPPGRRHPGRLARTR
jgi:hypothetical protein